MDGRLLVLLLCDDRKMHAFIDPSKDCLSVVGPVLADKEPNFTDSSSYKRDGLRH